MSGIIGSGGGSVPSTTVNSQPAAGTGQFYQPQQQPQVDASYLNVLNGLLGTYNAGGTAAQQLYPQAATQASFAADQSSPTGPLTYAADNIIGNPYYGQQVQSAVDASNYTANSVGSLQNLINTAINSSVGGQLNSAQAISSGAPFSSQLAQNTAGLGANVPGNSTATAALAPGLANLSSQVAGGVAPTQGLAGQVAGTLPQYQALANQASGLFQQSQDLTSGIAGNIPGIQSLAQQISALVAPTAGLSQGVGQNAAAINQLAGQPTGASQLQGAAAGVYGLGNQLASQPTGAPQLQGAGAGVYGLGNQLASQPTGANTLQGGAGAILNTAFDPQSALYNRTSQQLRDQQNAVNSASGVGTSPYGAGVTGQTLGNFNIDWQNQQLARQQAGLNSAGSALTQAQGLNQGQLNLANTGLGALQNSLQGAQQLNQGQLNLAQGGLQSLQSGLTGAQNLNTGQANLYNQAANLAGLQANINAQAAGIGAQGISGLGQAANVGSQALAGLQTGSGIQQGIANLISGGGNQAAVAGGLYNTAGNIGGQAGNLATGAGNLYNSATNQLATGANINTAASQQQSQAATQNALAADIYGRLPATAGANTTNVGNLTQLQAAAGGLPATAYNSQQQQNFNVINALANAAGASLNPLATAANIGQAQYNLPQTLLSDFSNYLNLGQNASLAGANLGAIGTQNQTNAVSGLNTLLGGAGASGLLFGSGGAAGALGLGSGGLVGSLFGGGATDFTGGAAGLGGVSGTGLSVADLLDLGIFS